MVDIAILVPTQTVLTDTKYSGYSAQAYTDAVQADLNYLAAIGGGKFVVTLKARLVAPYRGTDGIFPGYIANDEQRRANKAIILYNMQDIEIEWLPGATWDRSQDAITDDSYAPYSTTIYISKSKRITLTRPNMIGYQEDVNLLNDVKAGTSGDHIQVNNGCEDIRISDPTFLDGSSGIVLGPGRTNSHTSIDPAIPPVKNITISGTLTCRNCEHAWLFMACNGVFMDYCHSEAWPRGDGSTGAVQRGGYLHSCKNVHIGTHYTAGAFKTALLIADYDVVEEVTIDNLIVPYMFSDDDFFSITGSHYPTNYDCIGISVQSQTCRNINIKNIYINNVITGIMLPEVGIHNFRIGAGSIRSAGLGIATTSVYPPPTSGGRTTLDNPINGLVLNNIEVVVSEIPTGFSAVNIGSGLLLNSAAVDGSSNPINGKHLQINGCSISSRNFNARVLGFDGNVSFCDFTRITGLAGARNYDFNYYGNLRLAGNTYGNNGRPNSAQDAPTASLITGYADEDVRLTAVAANTSFTVPPGYAIEEVFVANTTANAVTGGLKFGTTSGATDVIAAYAVAANQLGKIPDAQLLKSIFSLTVFQTIFIQPVTAWNSASLSITARLRKVV